MKRKRATATKGTPSSSKKAVVSGSHSKTGSIFDSYKEQNEDIIGPEGIERLCKDIGVKTSDREVLLLAYVMDAKKMGYFTRSEFTKGLQALDVKTIAQLKKSLPKLHKIGQNNLKTLYDYAFMFCLTDPGQKIIDIETTCQMLPLVLPDGRFVDSFCEFLGQQEEYTRINADQWGNFFRFSQEVDADMSNADENPAWPLLLDNFVSWYTDSKSSS